MTKPNHCGKSARPYRKVYRVDDWGEAWETGFRCRVCPEIRLPFVSDWPDTGYMAVMPALREQGVAFDEWLWQQSKLLIPEEAPRRAAYRANVSQIMKTD